MGCGASKPVVVEAAETRRAGVTNEVSIKRTLSSRGERVTPATLAKMRVEFFDQLSRVACWDEYTMEEEVGRGSYAVVRAARHKRTNERVAVKIMACPEGLVPGEHHVESLPEGFTPQEGGTDLDCEDVFKEVAILRRLDSPHALRLREYFISPGGTVLYIVTDLLEGGQLLHALLQQGEEAYGETDARAAFAGLDNLLLAKKGDLNTVRIVDFGLAAGCFEEDPADEAGMRWLCGSAVYMAPEVADRRVPYTCAADLWSAGVVLHLLLTGMTPFSAPEGGDDEAALDVARRADWAVSYDGPEWAGISTAAKHFLAQLLTKNPAQRLDASRAMLSDWVTADLPQSGGGGSGGGAGSMRGSLGSSLTKLRRYAAAADYPVVKFKRGEHIPMGLFLIQKGTVEVLVEDDEARDTPMQIQPDDSSSRPRGFAVPAASDAPQPSGGRNDRAMKAVGSRGAGELCGELGGLIYDNAGRLSLSVGGELPLPLTRPEGVARSNSSASMGVGAASLDGSFHGAAASAAAAAAAAANGHAPNGGAADHSHGGGPASHGPLSHGPWSSSSRAMSETAAELVSVVHASPSSRGLETLRTASMVALTHVEAVPLSREDVAWAMAHDAAIADEVHRFVANASTHDLQALSDSATPRRRMGANGGAVAVAAA